MKGELLVTEREGTGRAAAGRLRARLRMTSVAGQEILGVTRSQPHPFARGSVRLLPVLPFGWPRRWSSHNGLASMFFSFKDEFLSLLKRNELEYEERFLWR